jgi:hypothetical protein
MESRSEHSPPEPEWNAKYYTPQPPGRPTHTETAAQDSSSAAVSTPLCARVREQLQSLLENDGTVRAEQATALYGHVAVCAECAREFEAMQRVVHMLEAMPLADLPTDYSRLIMRRIQTGQAPAKEISAVQTAGLCDRVREKLQPLLDNDLGIRPEMATALYGHLAVCTECANEFSTMRRMINMLETLPSVELPIDYSARIMKRIQAGNVTIATPKEQAVLGPTFAASSLVSGEVATHEKRTVTRTLSSSLMGETRLSQSQRLLVSVGLSGLFVYLLASDWGRQMLGVNLEAARAWITQLGEHLERVPVLGALIVSLSAALASVNEALSHTFTTLGGVAAQTLALEVSIGLAACLLVGARRRNTIPGI